MPTVKHLERKISDLEGFDIDFVHRDGTNARGDFRIEANYSYANRAPHSNTVAQFARNRFKKAFAGFDVVVFDGAGNSVPGNTKLKSVRESYG